MNPVHVWRGRAWNVRGFILRVRGGGEKEGGESTVERRGYSRGLPRIDLI